MRKILILVLLFPCNIAISQVLTSDSKGASTIVHKGTSAGINFSDQALSLTINQYNNYIDTTDSFKKFRYLWGLSINVKNNEGIANIFTSGNISPDTKLSGYSGIFKPIYKTNEIELINQISGDYTFTNTLNTFNHVVDSILIKDPSKSVNFKKHFLLYLQNGDTKNDYADSLMRIYSKNPELETAFKFYDKKFSKFIDRYKPLTDTRKYYIDSLFNLRKSNGNKYFIFYTNYGLSSNSFKQFSKLDSQNVKNSFNKENFMSPFINVGANYNTNGRWTLGGSIGYARANNFDSLTNKTFKYSTTLIDSTGAKLTSEKEIDAYEGNYAKFNRLNINTDVLYWAKVSDSISLVWDVVYIRYSYSDNKIVSRTSLNIGTSIFFLKRTKGNWLGGIYLETNNLFEPSINEKNALKFGLIAKFTFKSILGTN